MGGVVTDTAGPVLDVRDLRIETVGGGVPIVRDLSLSLQAGEVLGLVGESGSGKSTTGFALLGYSRRGLHVTGGSVTIGGRPVDMGDHRGTRALRGRLVSHVPQDPGTSLNPSLRVGAAISLLLGELREETPTPDAVRSIFTRVALPADDEFLQRFPHQLSGGQQQRVLIGAAVAGEPAVVVLDEPTTGLDVVTQQQILGEISRLNREHGIAMVYVSHDLAVVSQVAHRVAVMYAGQVVEQGPIDDVLSRPRHPYTRGLVAAIPDPARATRLEGIPGTASRAEELLSGCAFASRCSLTVARCEREPPSLRPIDDHLRAVRCFEADRVPALETAAQVRRVGVGTRRLLTVEHLRAAHGHSVIVDDVSFEVSDAECLALVGESGSGKTTIARCIAGLHPPAAGRILLEETSVGGHARDRSRELRRRLQIVFQNPYDSLNPRRDVADQVARSAQLLRGMSGSEARREAARLLELVHLPGDVGHRRPGELSGGQRQRVAIARALAAEPDILICDEVTSALDVSVQAAVINLLERLRVELGMALLFITHDLGVVRSIADRVLVLEGGQIQEQGPVEAVFAAPQHPRTRELLAAAPTIATRPVGAERPAVVTQHTQRSDKE
jgi:peptide/nickel transport system ATP-binding protein